MPEISPQPPHHRAASIHHIPVSRAAEKTRLVMRWIDAHNSRDVEAMLACATTWVEFHPLRLIGGKGGPYVGADGLRGWLGDVRRAGLGHTLDLNELKETADDQVVAHGCLDLPGSADAAEFFGVYRFVGGLIAGAYHYISDSRTMEIVGRLN